MPTAPTPGRSFVTRRAVRDIVRNAAGGAYGVTGFAGGGPVAALLDRLGIRPRGIVLHLDGAFGIDLHLTVAYGLPVAEVARQVDAAVRYELRRAIGREPDRLTIHVAGLRYEPGAAPPAPEPPTGEVTPGDLAASGSDVAG